MMWSHRHHRHHHHPHWLVNQSSALSHLKTSERIKLPARHVVPHGYVIVNRPLAQHELHEHAGSQLLSTL
jgi:hypothetical protein